MTHTSIKRLIAQVRRHGMSAVLRRMYKRTDERLGDKFGLKELDFPIRTEDLADSGTLGPNPEREIESTCSASKTLRIGWVCAPPEQGSGGHTTLFRMVAAMIEKGHHCTILLYDKNSDSIEHHVETIRAGWPWLSADLISATAIVDSLDVVIASSWQSAHVIASRMRAVPYKFYFIQDYEPFFYARGSLYSFAEDSYRFGFYNVVLGDMVASSIRQECDAPIHAVVPFGCDEEVYHLKQNIPASPVRNGVAFYAKKNNERRGYLLGKQALEIFGRNNPDQLVHVYGDRVSGWNIPIVNHGRLTPDGLNDLYNSTISSLALSFTNISLVAGELISAGNIPVLNDSKMARLDMKSPYVVWASATPVSLAAALEKSVACGDIEGRAKSAGGSRQPTWQESQDQLCEIIEQTCSVQGFSTEPARMVDHE